MLRLSKQLPSETHGHRATSCISQHQSDLKSARALHCCQQRWSLKCIREQTRQPCANSRIKRPYCKWTLSKASLMWRHHQKVTGLLFSTLLLYCYDGGLFKCTELILPSELLSVLFPNTQKAPVEHLNGVISVTATVTSERNVI